MKTLLIHFKTAGYCSMGIEVPDEYQIPTTNPREFWEDLYEIFHDKIEIDIIKSENLVIDGQDFIGFDIDQMVLDSIQRVYVHQNGKEERVDFDPMSFDS